MVDDTRTRGKTQATLANWLTPKEVQRELQLGERSVYRLLRDGTIPSVRLNGVYRINRKHLSEDFLVNPMPGKSA